jgi:hypothetical protein
MKCSQCSSPITLNQLLDRDWKYDPSDEFVAETVRDALVFDLADVTKHV